MKIEIKKEKKTVRTYKHAWGPRAHGSGDLNSGTQTDQGFIHWATSLALALPI